MASKNRERWLSLREPSSYSSAENVARSAKAAAGGVREELEKSVLFQAHRDLRERFERRSNFATAVDERWEMDLADLGKRVPDKLSGLPAKPGRKQTLMLVVVDVFSRAIYAVALGSKRGEEVARALERVFAIAGGMPSVIESDAGLEFRNRPLTALLERHGIRQSFARGLHKARQAERAIRSLKRVILASVQTDTWPEGKSWKEVPEIAAKSLRGRYNRMIKTTPARLRADARQQSLERARQWDRAGFVSLEQYDRDESSLRAGREVGGLAVGDFVLPPIPKQRRAEIRDKESMMHYSLMPMEVAQVFHARRPYLYLLKSPSTGRKARRLYYKAELKKATLPVDAKHITNVRVVGGRAEYQTSPGVWVKSR